LPWTSDSSLTFLASFSSPYKYFNPDEDVSTGTGTSGASKPFMAADSAYSSPGPARRQESTESRRTNLVGQESQQTLTADDLHEVVEENLTPEKRTRLIERLRNAMRNAHVGFEAVSARSIMPADISV
jgi:hypothetical protein